MRSQDVLRRNINNSNLSQNDVLNFAGKPGLCKAVNFSASLFDLERENRLAYHSLILVIPATNRTAGQLILSYVYKVQMNL